MKPNKVMKLDKLLYSPRDAAEILGMGKNTITRDVHLGRIACRRYGRRLLIPATEILRIAQEGLDLTAPENTVEAPTAA